MQTIFKKIKKNIVDTVKTVKKNSSKGLLKRVLGVLILLGLGSMLFAQNNVYAQAAAATDPAPKTTATEQVEKIIDINEVFNFGLKFIYALLWPVLFIAGGALDNTWVYGSFLHLDASLWSLRNIMKNFANFALGFMVLFAIVKNLFSVTSESDGEWSPIKIIKKTLIAGVLIQMSWFLMAAVIDISTIMTYSIGGLPMTVLHNNPEYKDKPILGINANLDMNDSNGGKMELDYYSTYGDKKIALCRVDKVSGLTGQYILGRQKINIDTGSWFEEGLCTWGAWPYRYKEYMGEAITMDNKSYKIYFDDYIKSIETGVALQNVLDCNFIDTDPSSIPENCTTGAIVYGSLSRTDNFFKDDDGKYELTVDSLLEKSKGFVGPFITIYSSILDFSSIAASPNGSKGIISQFFELLIKFAFAAALFFPLVALAAVLIARIGILWLAIVISPILALLNVFKDAIGDHMTGMFETFTLPNLIKLIFAPVFVVFAISMSLIFLTALSPNNDNTLENEGIGAVWLEEALGLTQTEKGYSAQGLVEMDLGKDGDGIGTINNGLDTFAWIVTNLFAVGIVWFFLFFAIKMTKIGETIGGGIQSSMQKLMSNLPIMPIPGGGMVGVAAAGKGMDAFKNKVTTNAQSEQEARLRKSMPWLYGDNPTEEETIKSGSKSEAWENYEKAKAGLAAGTYTTAAAAFKGAGLTESQQKIISSYDSNYITNITNYTGDTYKEMQKFDKKDNFTNADAQKYTSDSLNANINGDGDWNGWAKSMLGGAVHTQNGVYIMDNINTASDPEYRLVTQDVYEKRHFGQSLGKMNAEELGKVKSEKADELKEYNKKRDVMENEYNDLKSKEDKSEQLSADEMVRFKQLIVAEKDGNFKLGESNSGTEAETSTGNATTTPAD